MLAVQAKGVCVEYNVHEYRFNTFKEYVFQTLRGESGSRTFKALQDIDLSIQSGESVALIGHNGSGKSTLLKSIAGVIPPTQGLVSTRGRLAPMIELGTGFDPELSGRENIVLSCTVMGLKKSEIESIEQEIIAFSELESFIDHPLKNYSSGMYARLGFACATAIKPDILIVDEVLSVGDSNFARKCLHRIHHLRSDGTTFILVSHDAQTVKNFCDRGIVLEDGVMKFDGSVHDALKTQDEIMDGRYLKSLPVEQRDEIIRTRAIEQNKKKAANSELPEIQVRHWVEVDGKLASHLKTTEAFTVVIELSVQKSERLIGELNVGIGLNTPGGQRVGGLNLGEAKSGVQPLSQETVDQGEILSLSFDFPKGLNALASGHYHLVVGVMDAHETRLLVPLQPVDLHFLSPSDENNFNGDIICFREVGVRAQIRTEVEKAKL